MSVSKHFHKTPCLCHGAMDCDHPYCPMSGLTLLVVTIEVIVLLAAVLLTQ